MSAGRRATRTGAEISGFLQLYRREGSSKSWSARWFSLHGSNIQYAEARGEQVRLNCPVSSVRIVKPDAFHFQVVITYV